MTLASTSIVTLKRLRKAVPTRPSLSPRSVRTSETMTGTLRKAIPPISTLSSTAKRVATEAVPTPVDDALPVCASPSSSANSGLIVMNSAKAESRWKRRSAWPLSLRAIIRILG